MLPASNALEIVIVMGPLELEVAFGGLIVRRY
jgi:hypothetical protein